jgi:hypothetical protein
VASEKHVKDPDSDRVHDCPKVCLHCHMLPLDVQRTSSCASH